jgi:hypothetical protein
MVDDAIDEYNPRIRGVLHVGMMSIGQVWNNFAHMPIYIYISYPRLPVIWL